MADLEADDSSESRPSSISSEESSTSVSEESQKPEKDPRKIARKYQLELCQKAVEENIIVYLGTGCGKTHIAVLLIYELGHFIKRPQKNVCVFLAPTVALVQQQARVIEESVDFNVGICSSSKRLKSHELWEKEMLQYEVLLMTPQILLHCLSHCFIKMEAITLLIFDECHHAQVKSNHPYAEIMRAYFRADKENRPRVFGMTASPVIGKGSSGEGSLAKCINSLESLLDSKVYSVEHTEDLDKFVASATVKVYHYHSVSNGTSNSYSAFLSKLTDLRRECLSALGRGTDVNSESQRNTKKLLNRLHDNLLFCLDSLGIWGSLQAIRILLNHSEWNELIDAEGDNSYDSVCDRYLAQAAKVLDNGCTKDGVGSDLSSIEVLKEPFFSNKLLRLVGILSAARLQPDMKCIVFVNRVITARSLSYILQSLEFLGWKCDSLVGLHSGLKSASRKAMKLILEKFRSGELNLLVATKVGEEGLDIQTCCLVIRFDLPETVASFIQSRGRARMAQSEYAFLVNSGNQKDLDLIENFKQEERLMNFEIAGRTSKEVFVGVEERVYQVISSGASISSAYSVSLLHRYCSKLPHDEYFEPQPKFFFLDDPEGTVCHIVLPSNAPMHLVIGSPQSTTEAAKKDACLKAIKDLHKQGSLNDYLLPMLDDESLDESLKSLDLREDDSAQIELYEMVVPAVLKEPWTTSEIPVNLSSYYMVFTPEPADRVYTSFGLFIKENLPKEAERMELELHLARNRTVMTKLVPTGLAEFYEDEIILAERFQEMFLNVILNRTEFVSEFVPLGKKLSPSTFYLLLPVTYHDQENTLSIDWKTIRRCLSSPVYRPATNIKEKKLLASELYVQLSNGPYRISDIVGSLVYVPHVSGFFFIANIDTKRNGHSPFESYSSYVDLYNEKYDIQLKYPEQYFLCVKPVFSLHNLLHVRNHDDSVAHHLDEYFVYMPPELCQLKIIGFSKEMGSSVSLLPSIMHRLENLLVAIQLKNVFCDSFPEGSEVSVQKVLEALTTERCMEGFSLERLEVLGDSFLKFVVGRHLFLLHGNSDEGQLTYKRSNMVCNLNLFKLACKKNLQGYIRDKAFDPSKFYALGHPCPIVCNEETENDIHFENLNSENKTTSNEVRCNKSHHWLFKKTVADSVEALIGAFIVDSGFKAATAFLRWIGLKVDFDTSQVTDACISSTKYIPLATEINVTNLEKSLGYSFVHKGLLLQAFVHPSFNKTGGGCYQRLEFLGDAVLDYLMMSYLYSVYPKLNPGQLTDLRSAFVSNQAFAYVALDRSFQKFLISDSDSLSKAVNRYVDYVKAPSSDVSSADCPKCPKALGDLVESCVGAILIDTGFDLERTWKIMLSFLDPIMSYSSLLLSPIKELQEICNLHSINKNPFLVKKKGNVYVVVAEIKNDSYCVTASATNVSIKEAKKMAAEQLFVQLKTKGIISKSSSLERVLESTLKMEAKLLGYDEIPIDVTLPPDSTAQVENQTLQEPSIKRYVPKFQLPSKNVSTSSSVNTPNGGSIKTDDQATSSHTNGGSVIEKTARAQLYEICTANCWKPPVFECCDEEGPGHLKLFTYKVLVEIEEGAGTNLTCHSLPHHKKKAAAEHAAEGAVWFLKKQGYL